RRIQVWRCLRAWSVPPLPVWVAWCHSGGYCAQPGQLDEIIGSHCQRERAVELFNATQPSPRHSPDGLAARDCRSTPLELTPACLPLPFLASVASGSVVELCVSLLRCSP